MPTGPYDTERQALTGPLGQAVRALHDTGAPHRVVRDHQLAALRTAATDAGIALGAYDETTLAWLAGWTPATVQVVIGLITRAHTRS